MVKVFLILLCILGSSLPGISQEKLVISGKIRTLEPTEVRLSSIAGEDLCAAVLDKKGTFSMKVGRIVPDIYVLTIGGTSQAIYLTNKEVTIKGFYDNKKPENSSLDFTGIEEFVELARWVPTEVSVKKRMVSREGKGKLRGTMYSALAYLADMEDYASNKMLLEQIPEEDRDAASVRWLARRVDSLGKFAVGAEAYDFELVNPEGKSVRLSDFRGKYVLVDFWASWCGPCRQEMKRLLPIYEELKGEDLEFVSVSLDKREQDWRKMLDAERLPWVMLWDKEGFSVGDEPNAIQRAYGFYSIPFIVLIDKEGRIAGRELRGEQVKEAILKARQGN